MGKWASAILPLSSTNPFRRTQSSHCPAPSTVLKLNSAFPFPAPMMYSTRSAAALGKRLILAPNSARILFSQWKLVMAEKDGLVASTCTWDRFASLDTKVRTTLPISVRFLLYDRRRPPHDQGLQYSNTENRTEYAGLSHARVQRESAFSSQKLAHFRIQQQIPPRQRPAQEYPLQGAATAQGHIGLPMREGPLPQIDDHPVESFPLAFVDGHGPGQLERKLREAAHRLRHDPAGFGIQYVAHAFPGGLLHAHGSQRAGFGIHVPAALPPRYVHPYYVAAH